MTKAEAIAMLKRIQEPEAWEPQINQAAFEALDMAIEALGQPRRKKGEWINKKYRWIKSISMWWYSAYKCSICGEAGIKDWNYCPNCGADMRGENE